MHLVNGEGHAAFCQVAVGLAHLLGRIVANADGGNPSPFHLFCQRCHQRFLAHEEVEGPMDLVEANAVLLQAFEAFGQGIGYGATHKPPR